MTIAERTAASVLPDFPARTQSGPGQFAFADPELVHRILDNSGWRAIAIRPIDVPCRLPQRQLRTYVTRMGPVGALFQSLDDDIRADLASRLDAAFEPFVDDGVVSFTAACWMVTARA